MDSNLKMYYKRDDMGQIQGCIGWFHAIVQNLLLDLVMFKLNVTMIARMHFF